MTVVRPMLTKVVGRDLAKRRVLAGPAAGGMEAAGAAPITSSLTIRDSQAAKMIELAKVNGKIQQESLERVTELVKVNPAETVAVLRKWINDGT
jgi:flagellar M-ring protein FliF